MLRLGKFTEAIERGDERRSSLRKENAQLYSEFVSNNPGASLEERTDYAQTLINDTGVGNRGLPTRAAMQKNVDTYKKEEARKSAAAAKTAERERQAAIRQQQQDITMVLNNAAENGDSDDEIKATMEALGIDTSNMEGRTKRLNSIKFDNWVNDNSSALEAYLQNPTAAGYAALEARGGAAFKEEIEGRYKGSYVEVERKQVTTLEASIRDLALKSTDLAQYESDLQALMDKYPQAVQDKVSYTISLGAKQFDEKAAERLSAAVVTARGKLEALSNELGTKEVYERKRDQLLLTLPKEVQDELNKNGDRSLLSEYNGNFDFQAGLRTDASVQVLRNSLSDLSRKNLPTDDYEVELKELLAQYPQAVQDGAAKYVTQANDNFAETTGERLQEEVNRLTSDLDVLTMRTDITPELYPDMLAAKLALYSPEAQAAAQAAIAEDKANFVKRDEARTAVSKEKFSSDALFDLTELAMNPATTQEALTARINKDKRDATAGGFELGKNYGEAAQTKFDEKKAERKDLEERQITSLVQQQTEAALRDAANDTSFIDVRNRLEANLSASEGRKVVLNEDQNSILWDQFKKGRSDLQANMTLLASQRVEDVTQYASAVAQSKREFVDNFVIQMQAGTNGAVANARERFGKLAEETYDNIISKIREQNNQKEIDTIKTAVKEMNAARDTVDLSEAVKSFENVLASPSITGTNDTKLNPGILADISTDLLAKATRMASELDIPLTEEVYEQMVLILADTADASSQSEELGVHVKGQKFDPNLIRAALLNAFEETVGNAPNGGLERLAYQEALEKRGLDTLSLSKSKVVPGEPNPFLAFGAAFRDARTQMATERYDIFSPSFAGDVERSTPLVQDATKASSDNDPNINEAVTRLRSLLSLSEEDYIENGVDIDAVDTAQTNIIALVPTLNANIEDIDTELRRLDALSRSSIYKTSEHAQSVTDRITQLNAVRVANNNTLAQIEDAKEKYKLLGIKDFAARNKKYEIYTAEQAQIEFDAFKASGGGHPRGLSPEARLLYIAERNAKSQQQRDDNESWFDQNILGPKWRSDVGD